MTQETYLSPERANEQQEVFGFNELQSLMNSYGLAGENPQQRAESLRATSPEQVALFMTDLNRHLLDSEESEVYESTMKIGEKEAIAPEDRYNLFIDLHDAIIHAPEDTSPVRIGDALALSTVLLHPFKDGNGRTARVIGLIFNDDFDAHDAPESFEALSASRDKIRTEGGNMVYGYIPYLKEGEDQTNPQDVNNYIGRVLTGEDSERLYNGPYGQAKLRSSVDQSTG